MILGSGIFPWRKCCLSLSLKNEWKDEMGDSLFIEVVRPGLFRTHSVIILVYEGKSGYSHWYVALRSKTGEALSGVVNNYNLSPWEAEGGGLRV